jgi:hypothetical protein
LLVQQRAQLLACQAFHLLNFSAEEALPLLRGKSSLLFLPFPLFLHRPHEFTFTQSGLTSSFASSEITPSTMARPISTTRPLTLAEKLQAWSDDEFDLIVRDAAEDDANAIGFRHASVPTQKRQDRHLELYYNYMRKKSPSLTTESAEELVLPIAFPANQDVFNTQFRQ